MRISVQSFGCSTNLADGGVLKGCLAEAGHEIVESVSDAELVICNTCAVKGPTEDRMIEVCKRVPPDKKLVIAGCLPLINSDRLFSEVKFDAITGPAIGREIVDVVRRVGRGEKVVKADRASLPDLALPRFQSSPVVSIVPISYGCLGSCAYCCVINARGRLRSHGIDEIVKRVKSDLALGLREFWLTSQDAACYGKDKNTSLPDLLRSICRLKGDFYIRVGMMTPNVVGNDLDRLLDAFKDRRVFSFLHVPVQSGDDDVLRRMGRRYRVEDFRHIVEAFREVFPSLTLATDIICGFPGETSEAFEHTLRLIEDVRPDVVNVSKFFARPGTSAALMVQDFVSRSEINRRTRSSRILLAKISREKNERWVGWKGEVLVDEKGKVRGSWVGRNFAYKSVVLREEGDLMGKCLNVKVVEAFPTYLRAELLNPAVYGKDRPT